MTEAPIDVALINTIAWAPGCMHLKDIIALACDDGTVRLLEVTVHKPPASILATRNQPAQPPPKREMVGHRQATTSGITAGLAGIDLAQQARTNISGVDLKHEGTEIAILEHEEGGPVFRVKWNIDGD